MDRFVFTLVPTAPYDFGLTAAYATYFRGHYGAEIFVEGVFRRLLDIKNHLCLVSVRSFGAVDSPKLGVELSGPALDEDVAASARDQTAWILGTDQDLIPFYRMAQGDPVLTPLITDLRGLHIPHTTSVYEALVLAILGQQISSHLAHQVRTRLIQTYGASRKVLGVIYHAFPRPEVLVDAGEEGLSAIKLSARKARYIVDNASWVVSGELNLEGLRACSDEEVVHRLTSIRGVGAWTAQWLLIRGLGRPDAFPHGDLALARNLKLLVGEGGLLRSDGILGYSHRWSPFRSYATTYVFAAIRSGRLAGFKNR